MTDELDLLRDHMATAPAPSVATLARAERALQDAMDETASLEMPVSPHSRRARLAAAVLVVAVAAAGVGWAVVARSNPSSTPSEAMAWRLVSSPTSPFRSLPQGGQTDLQCVTDVVCYSPGAESGQLFRTTDGGQNWISTAPIPGTAVDGGEQLHFSCSSVDDCAVVVGAAEGSAALARLDTTTDGGAHWSTSPIPAPLGLPHPYAGSFDCTDGLHCVVTVTGQPSPPGSTTVGTPQTVTTFLSTADGGATWVQATAVPSGAGPVWTLKCSTDVDCLAITLVGSFPHPHVVALRSDDGGLTWTAGPPAAAAGGALLYASCGDGSHCMLVSVGGPAADPYTVATTADGGATWHITGPPAGWQNMPTAVSCATAEDCWVAMSTYDTKSPAGAYSDPTIEATRDGGLTWSTIPLPTHRPPISDVLTLNCPPTGDGCMGIGNLQDHFLLPPGKPHPLSGPLVISNLPSASP